MARSVWPNGAVANLADVQACVGPGWADLVRRCYESLPDGSSVHQVKEKYGGLRFYASVDTPEIDEAERESLTVCEDCGAPGASRSTPRGARYGWTRTLCDGCYK